jgi:hypothetical protein
MGPMDTTYDSPSYARRLGLQSEWGYGILIFLILFILALLSVSKSWAREEARTGARQTPTTLSFVLTGQDLNRVDIPVRNLPVVENVKVL